MTESKELEEFRLHAHKDEKLYKDKTKMYNDKHIISHTFEYEQKVLVFNSKPRLFPKKHKPNWYDPFEVMGMIACGTVEILDNDKCKTFLVNGLRAKHY